ncbi:MAG: tetratricopeptide repeat protein [Gammaproteobacteria bacterium]|nr:tetratricopeptide repeat protein [Gammaproteobacteria bacterium]
MTRRARRSLTPGAPRNQISGKSKGVLRRFGPTLLAVLAAVSANADPLAECRDLGFSDPEGSRNCFRDLLADPSTALRAEAAWALGDIQLANGLFRSATKSAPDDAVVRVRWGELFLSTYQVADAEALFAEALAIDPDNVAAKLGLARVALGRFEARAMGIVESVLAGDPDHVEANLLAARLALQVGDTERARESLRSPLVAEDLLRRLEGMALAAAIDHMLGSVPSAWEAKALEIHPRYGELFETVAHFYVITRRYREAIAQLTRAVAIDPELWSAHATLGINLLRVNRFDEGRRTLTLAHDGDPYNVEVVNTLRLLDSLDGWGVLADDDVILRIHPAESGALASYVKRLVTDAVATVGERYGFVPDYPVVVELYPRHQDFAVRTSGLPGIGVLGVAFGDVVLMDSPSARSVVEGFDWASALWHEVAHVVTLGATNNLVSRWFSEGVSVFEEWQTGPSRFRGTETAEGAARYRAVPIGVVKAHREAELLPIALLDEGFIRPTYLGQVMVSYTQAGLVCEFIAHAYGQAALSRILDAYRDGKDTVGSLEAALDTTHHAVDEAFEAYLDDRFAGVDPATYELAMQEAAAAASKGDWALAAEAARRAIAAYPNAAGVPSPYPLLARAEAGQGNPAAAVDALFEYWRAGGRSPNALNRLAGALDDAQRHEDALAVRRSLALTLPLAVETRTQLGDDLLEAGQPREALLEYQAVLSLEPHDAADAHYRLARAYHRLNESEDARRHVLLALEIAPRFQDALSLLLEINQ